LLSGLNRKLMASSLIEVIISVVIISIVFLIAISILIKVTDSNNSIAKIKADLLQDKILNDVLREKSYYNKSGTFENYIYNVKIREIYQCIEVKIIIESSSNETLVEKVYIVKSRSNEI
jgi:Tfp pilus assembly protein PilV